MKTRLCCLILALAATLGLAVSKAETFTLSIIHMADQEAAMDALFDVPNASSVINALKDKYENTIILSSGDNYITGPFFNASANDAMGEILGAAGLPGRADILINNYFGIQASAVGNHEFDAGPEVFNHILSPEEQYAAASFPYLSANLDFSKSVLSGKVKEAGQLNSSIPSKVASSCVIEVNGKRIGIVGATTPTLPQISSIGKIETAPAQSSDHKALAGIIQKEVDALTAQGIQIIILISHMQDLAIEEELAGYLKDVDVIIGGGSDAMLFDENDRPREGDADLAYGSYPLWKTSLVGQTSAVLNTDGQYRYVGRFVAQFDVQGKLLKSYDPEVSGAFATDAVGVETLGSVPADPRIVSIIEKLKSLILTKDQNILGVYPDYLEGRKFMIRTRPTNLGELIAKANLWYARKYSGETVDACIINSGGIRASIGLETVLPGATEISFLPNPTNSYRPEGGISQLNIEAAQAFNNKLVLVTLTGVQIKETLEEAVRLLPNQHGGFPQVAGLSYAVDPSAQARKVNTETDEVIQSGSRIQKIMIGEKIIFENGAFTEKPKPYRIATLSYLAGGGNGYPIKNYIQADASKVNLVNLSQASLFQGSSTFSAPGTEQDALAEYLKEFHFAF